MTVIGIDLGTSNSVVAYWREEEANVIPNNLGEILTPSVVSIDEEKQLLVGQVAKERLLTHPDQTAALFKRDMGTDKTFELGGEYYLPEELSSFVLRKLKEDAEHFLKEEIEEAVISVPAYFNDRQRKSTKRAAELAGLKVERLISEPTAAALSYGLHEFERDCNFLVFDLGGGTYDVSILEKFAGVIQVRAIAGDNYLGGEDFTKAIYQYILQQLKIAEDDLKSHEKQSVMNQAEQAKRLISQQQEIEITITINEEYKTIKFTSTEFDTLVKELALRVRSPIVRALNDASLRPEDLDAVVLVGGATRMPLIKKLVSKIIGQIPFSNIDPDQSVAVGTAIQAALKQRDQSLKEVILTDVCPFTLGTDVVKEINDNQIESGYFYPIIERNTPIPISIVKRLYTVYDNQPKLKVDVYQGENRITKENLKIGEVVVEVPPAPAGEGMVDVRYTYDVNGILEVECTPVSTGITKRIVIEQNPGNMSNEEIDKRLKELEAIKIHPRNQEENRLLISKGERLYQESLGERREYIAQLLEAFERVLATQRPDKIEQAAHTLRQHLNQLEGGSPPL
ncbi:molecular chaperone HscC [Gracilibacillus thailandensis]|uniref:Chaperone protein DnaK n=1 Tax=Gracilibacillus thailandensis TaxID=563735 RepID=A0A6N7QZU9_9BACI|nr:molecular chaperone HscC [Gracilibacillus thailandensis]MRI66405.1 Hsp70 family protein [Gracilibacillus thailandensis]